MSLLRKCSSANGLPGGELDFRLAGSWGIMRAAFEPTENFGSSSVGRLENYLLCLFMNIFARPVVTS